MSKDLLDKGSPFYQITGGYSKFPFLIVRATTEIEAACWFFLCIERSNRIDEHLFTPNNYISLAFFIRFC